MKIFAPSSSNQTTITNASSPNTNDLEELRNWYQRRSQDFTSANFLKYVDDRKLMAKIEDGLMRFEKKLQAEKEQLHREFERKLILARTSAPRPMGSILSDYLIVDEKIRQLPGLNAPATNSSVSTMQFLRPSDFCEYSSESEEETESGEEISNGQTEGTNEREDIIQQSFGGNIEKANGENVELKNKALFSTTLASETNFCTSTPIKSHQEPANSGTSIAPPPEKEEILDNGEGGQFFKWLRYFNSFEHQLRREISTFENDPTKKEFRIELSRTVANRINDCAKKNFSIPEMGGLFKFFDDLLGCDSVDSWREGNKFSLTHGDKSHQLFAMETICTRYLEQVKWDSALMEHILLVLAKLCKRSVNFYKIFCAKIVHSVLLLCMDQDKVISKIVGFGIGQPQEAVAQWLNNERSVFQLFCKVQFTLKSSFDEAVPQKTQGLALIREMFTSVAQSQNPVILCSPFILSGLLQFVKLFNKQNAGLSNVLSEQIMPSIKHKIIGREWREFVSSENTRKLDECANAVLSARHGYLLDCLQNAIRKFEQ